MLGLLPPTKKQKKQSTAGWWGTSSLPIRVEHEIDSVFFLHTCIIEWDMLQQVPQGPRRLEPDNKSKAKHIRMMSEHSSPFMTIATKIVFIKFTA